MRRQTLIEDGTTAGHPHVNGARRRPRLPLAVYVLALGTFLMLTSEFVVAGILPLIAGDLGVSVAQAGSLITVFAVGMVVGAPLMAMLTMRMSKQVTLVLALIVFVAGHVVVALGQDFTVLLVARFVSALATGAFWAVSAVVATRAAGPSSGARAVGVVGAGGGGVLAAYSFIAPILIDQAGVTASQVPLVLTGFGIGSVIGTLLAARFGDAHPGPITIITPAVTTILLLGISLLTGSPWLTSALVVLLGLFGLSANSVLIHLAVRFAGKAATFGSALSVSAFNAGTAVGTAFAGAALVSPLGTTGPGLVGTIISALTLVPAIALASRRRAAAPRPVFETK